MTALGKYEIIDELGSGSMGIVYRAVDKLLDRKVALKVLRPESQLDPEIAERFRREARACAQLHHPSLVTIYELGEGEGGVTYIAMELLDGVDWRRLLKLQMQIPPARRIELIAQVCEGLGHAHLHGIVHRDIKPGNLFLHLGSQSKILDFGIARLATSVLTRTGRVLGTPNYMAPEQITGDKCDSRSDLFSVAIVAYEFLTGTHPFEARFIPQRIVNDEPDRLRDIAPEYPSQLDEALRRAMARDPDERFQSAEEFASVFRQVLASGAMESVRTRESESGAASATDQGAETATLVLPSSNIGKKEAGG